ncbi:hypothetical protein GW17_00058936 [Ensete ventricosum]|nr:hypothetical protein GW17_00058936 [Ensete ventricosum]
MYRAIPTYHTIPTKFRYAEETKISPLDFFSHAGRRNLSAPRSLDDIVEAYSPCANEEKSSPHRLRRGGGNISTREGSDGSRSSRKSSARSPGSPSSSLSSSSSSSSTDNAR